LQPTYLIHKNLGETPLEALERLRGEQGIAEDVPMTYAGRLDPAAEGLLLILTGEECKNKEQYTSLSKTYIAEIVFGVSTDTHDLLGLPKGADVPRGEIPTGTFTQKYPQYSSKTLWKEVSEAPTHEVTLHSHTKISEGTVSCEAVLARVELVAGKVKGEFRQKEILEAWQTLAPELPAELPILKVELEVGSGFYVRQLAEDMGGCLYSLIRTQIGAASAVDVLA
jgi:tRNA U55 pseudouridine synthase TruB